MSSKAVLYLHALTPLHPGSGTAIGVVDLPIQRERHTHWPLIPGSSLKGVLRDAWRERLFQEQDSPYQDRRQANEAPWVKRLFGPAAIGSDEGKSHIGALSITDARILAFPVRSLKGVFGWVTCPAVLQRFQRDLALAGFSEIPETLEVGNDEAYLPENSPLLVEKHWVLLEEFEFKAKHHSGLKELFDWLPEQLFAESDQATRAQAHNRFVILSNDDFSYFVKHATEVMARVGLDYETKTVKSGALFYEEFLPAETLFYSLVLADASRDRDSVLTGSDVMAEFVEHLPPYLQVGGDATIGKGLCALHLKQGEA